MSKTRSLLIVVCCYACAGAVALWCFMALRQHIALNLFVAIAIADLAATAVIAICSRIFNNTSIYDPYWSVAPPLMIGLLLVVAIQMVPTTSVGIAILGTHPSLVRLLLALVLFSIWGARLTFNWCRRWNGMTDEDWRYSSARRFRHWYWPISIVAFQLIPTLFVLAGCLPLIALYDSTVAVGFGDIVSPLIIIAGIALELVADRQLAHHRKQRTHTLIQHGLWGVIRHPNYAGELLVWIGLSVWGISVNPSLWWTTSGAAAMLLLFICISIPLKDRHMLHRYPAYAHYAQRTPALLPLAKKPTLHNDDGVH